MPEASGTRHRLRWARMTGIALAILLGGCVVTRIDPQVPEQTLPDALSEPIETSVSLPDPWWRMFEDPVLDELIDEALANNPDVSIAAARVAEARAGLRIANADRLPSIDVRSDATRTKDSEILSVPGFERTRTLYTVQGAVAYELDFWGRYQRASEAARAQLLATEYGREATKLSLTGAVARRYFALLASAQQLARARATLADREEALRLEQLRFDAGESDELTLKRAEADTAATRTRVHQLELELTRNSNALGVLLGRPPRELVDNAIVARTMQLVDAPLLPPSLPSAVLTRRPDIGAAEAALQAAAADIGVARALLFPRISLTGVFGSVSPELSDLFTTPMEAWSATGGLLQPIFQGGRLRANVARTEAVRAQRQGEYVRTVQVAFREVLDALRGQGQIAGVREASAQQVAALERATELAQLRYDQGDIAYLELLDARRTLFQAEIDLIAARRDALLNAVDLALAVGGGIGERAEPLSARR